ncbi:rhodanese-like domain-containing protein [Ottowia sp. VDI28]|uniref:rhodanese-like domain-containing protein n=1 Tax=Ottowia sp. VDI28 TaxID=3133968 RepID=UPI003C2C2F5C
MPPKTLDVDQLPAMLRDGGEIALLDLREEGDFTQGHLLLAASLPIGRFELDLPWRVPCRGTRIVLVGGGKARSSQALNLLESAGYTNVFLLDVSPSEYERAGLGWFSGKYVPSKAFGEVVETATQTPHIETKELLALKGKGAQLLMVDSRTPEEFVDFPCRAP